MKRKLTVIAPIAIFSLIGGCTEAMIIKTSPPGAKAYINGTYVGTTPTTYEYGTYAAPSTLLCKVERGGYLPQESTINKRIMPGRVAGTIFTAGLLALFKSPSIYKDVYDFELQPASQREPVPDTLTIDERFRRLEDLRRKKLITEEEYQAQRAAILHGL